MSDFKVQLLRKMLDHLGTSRQTVFARQDAAVNVNDATVRNDVDAAAAGN